MMEPEFEFDPDQQITRQSQTPLGKEKLSVAVRNRKTLDEAAMDFDEYEYLEKTVEEDEKAAAAAEGKKSGKEDADKSERSYRKREGEEDEEIVDGEEERRRRKRSRGDDSDGDRKERDRRRSGRDEDRERRRDKDRERERSRGEKENGRDKDKDKERDREREKGRSRERDAEREKGRSRDRDGEREKERERERERERDKREKERERRDREKEKERERELEERERSRRSSSRSRRLDERERERSRGRDLEFEGRDGRRFKDKKDAGEPEADPERDQRTVFAYQMPLKANEKDVYEFFSKAGKVRDVRLIMDRNSRRSKGVGYIEFYDVMSVPMAIALSGQLLMGQPVMVKPSEAEKNLVQSTASTGGSAGLAGPYGPVDRKLYVGNLHFNMTELQLRQIFEPFGTVELVQLPLDLETGHCKGFGFVQFAQVEHAKAAQSLNGKLEIAGRVIKVSSVTDHVGVQDTSAKSADFDDDEGGGLALNAHSRALLMQKLDRSGIATSIAGSLGIPAVNGAPIAQQAVTLPIGGQVGVPGSVLPMQVLAPTVAEPIGNPSECLVMKNMFDPATETDQDFDQDIKEDVEEECSNFGRVKHIFVDKNSAGYVYIRFDTIDAATKAQRAMHMRWFARRLVSALFMPTYEYDAKFKS